VCNSKLGDSEVVFNALENERQLDLRYKQNFSPPGRFVNYKVMKQVALRYRFGILMTPLLTSLALMVPFMTAVSWVKAFILSFKGGSPPTPAGTVWLVPTTSTNTALIRDAISSEKFGCEVLLANDLISILAPRLGPMALIRLARDLFHITQKSVSVSGRRVEMLLHSRDALNFLLLARFARLRCDDVFVTDDHYQRWAYVLSQSAVRFRLVQHGVLDHSICFPHQYGRVDKAYVRDQDSLKTFRGYYWSVFDAKIYMPAVPMTSNPFSAQGVFLASSYPSLQEEIDVARELKQYGSIPIIVKLHPAHKYDKRVDSLLSLADYICEPNESPLCKLFISHSSSMELIYQNLCIPTVSIKRAGGHTQAIKLIRTYFNTY
jgi:hypothetical protein